MRAASNPRCFASFNIEARLLTDEKRNWQDPTGWKFLPGARQYYTAGYTELHTILPEPRGEVYDTKA